MSHIPKKPSGVRKPSNTTSDATPQAAARPHLKVQTSNVNDASLNTVGASPVSFTSATFSNAFVHPFLSAVQVVKAKATFTTYCVASGSVTAAAASGVNSQDTSLPPFSMNAKGVQLFLADLNVVVTENEAKDMIFTLNQSPATLQKNRDVDRSFAQSTLMSGRTDATGSEAGSPTSRMNGAGGKSQFMLSFPLFLELLIMTHKDGSRDHELQSAFRTLDTDGDCVLTESDVRSALAQLLGEIPHNEDLQHLAKMTTEQWARILSDADLDGDGVVTVEDFMKILTTS